MNFSVLTVSDKISILGSVITIIGMIISLICAKSSKNNKDETEKYYIKAKDVTKFANIKESYHECKNLTDKFSELLKLSNIEKKDLRGANFTILVKEVAIEVDNSLKKIRQLISSEQWEEIDTLLKQDVNVQVYINSLITGIEVCEDEFKFKDVEKLCYCKEKANQIHDKLKEQSEKLEQKLK